VPGRVEVTFETGLLGLALQQAAAVAPMSGKDVTVFAGIIVEINVQDKSARIRATDAMTFYSTWLPVEIKVLNGTAEDMIWRFPSNAFSSVVNSLPSGPGKTVRFTPEGTQVSMKSGRMQAKFNLIDPDGFPNWDAFGDEVMHSVPGLREAMRRVEWCVMKRGSGMPPYNGILVGPDMVGACDRIRFAAVKIQTPFTKDHCVPLAVLRTIMQASKANPEVAISKDDSQWLAQVDEDTQYSSALYTAKWPNVRSAFERVDHPNAIEFDRDTFLAMAKRALQMSTSKRTSKLDLFIGDESLSVFCADTEMGFLGDSIELTGQATHDITKIRVMPENFLDMIQSADEKVIMHYRAGHQYVDNDKSSREHKMNSQLWFEIGPDYQVWCMPLTGKAIS